MLGLAAAVAAVGAFAVHGVSWKPALMAVLAWWAVMRGVNRRHQGGCLVQFVFGVMLINVLPLATFLAALFSANS